MLSYFSLMRPERQTPEKILQTGLAFWPSKTLLSAIEIGVFTELSRGPGRFDALADCAAWMRAAGFSTTRFEPLVGPDSMVVGIK
jgi:hypothetical protein